MISVQNILNFLQVYKRKIINEKALLFNKAPETNSNVFDHSQEFLQGELEAIVKVKQFITDNYDDFVVHNYEDKHA